MSVLIRGMEMPERCWDCDLCYDSYYCRPLGVQFADREDFEPGERRLSDCPLIPVPPHGRLIDADALRGAMYHEAFETDSSMQKWDSGCWIRYKMFENNIEDASTIIPAEGAENDLR